jgi:hypothetical protein
MGTDDAPAEMAEVIRDADDGMPIFPDVGQSMALVRQLRALDDETRAFLASHGLHVVGAAELAILKAANDFYDARLVLDDERTFDALMAAVHASREGNGTHTTG